MVRRAGPDILRPKAQKGQITWSQCAVRLGQNVGLWTPSGCGQAENGKKFSQWKTAGTEQRLLPFSLLDLAQGVLPPTLTALHSIRPKRKLTLRCLQTAGRKLGERENRVFMSPCLGREGSHRVSVFPVKKKKNYVKSPNFETSG